MGWNRDTYGDDERKYADAKHAEEHSMSACHGPEPPEPRGGPNMKELVFALQFKGKAGPVAGAEGKLAAKTTAGGQVLRTGLTAKGIQAKAESKPGPRATFESEV